MTGAIPEASTGSATPFSLSATGRLKIVPPDPWTGAGISRSERTDWISAGVSDLQTVMTCKKHGLNAYDMATALPGGGTVLRAIEWGVPAQLVKTLLGG